MPNGPYQGPLPVRVIPPGVSGDELKDLGFTPTAEQAFKAKSWRLSTRTGRERERKRAERKKAEKRLATSASPKRRSTSRARKPPPQG